ncbi:flagellar filament capping protein FliD [Aliifodinibius salicampi]|uniref:Flagellar hook-associated protein 2 n=1 Tax=Fodinibius salicampi TaxID=1920655 RepID=A0ABT3Q0D2_9BACT|nr:flagellar filament capping protein FliD [Fodinibius salicampi]MCW9713587.1 flagellar filament capping protein FliD [Fodinibius salicampi]
MNSISSLIQQTNPYEQFVQQLVMIESQKKFKLEDQRSTLNKQQSALSNVSSVISNFTNKIDELNSATSNSFNPLKATSSDESVVRVDSISGMTEPNNYDITVNRKATKDIMLSNVIDGTATDLAGFGDGSVDITIGDKTETISVTTTNDDGTTKTNQEVLESFSTAINDLLGEKSDSDVFQIDNDGNVQLSIKSTETGYDERIQFSNASGVLAEVTGNMTHLETNTQNLDSEFTVDGITFTRGQNTVENAISGMTFTLLDDPGTQEQISVTKDVETAKDNIDDFISTFNEMNKKIRNNTFINGETGNKGPLQGMRSIRNLTINLRQTALTDMTAAADGELDNLMDIGLGFENDGTMKIEDADLLEKALTDRPEEVQKLFTDDTSPVMAMYNQAEIYTQTNGVISSLESGLDQKIDFIDNRIDSENRYLEKYEERQRQEFAELQQIQDDGQRQFNAIMNYQSSLGF